MGERGGGGVKIEGEGLGIFVNFINWGGGGVRISKNPLITVINEKRDINV